MMTRTLGMMLFAGAVVVASSAGCHLIYPFTAGEPGATPRGDGAEAVHDGGQPRGEAGVDSSVAAASFKITAAIDATENTDNGTSPAHFDTAFKVTLTNTLNAGLSGALVTITSSKGAVALTASPTAGIYLGSQPGYYQDYTLAVTAGGESVTGLPLAGPAAHTFSQPTTTHIHQAKTSLIAVWSPSGARSAEIETDELKKIQITDSGSHTIGASYMQGEAGELSKDRLRVWRRESGAISKGAAGSTYTVEVRNEVEFLVDGT